MVENYILEDVYKNLKNSIDEFDEKYNEFIRMLQFTNTLYTVQKNLESATSYSENAYDSLLEMKKLMDSIVLLSEDYIGEIQDEYLIMSEESI